MPSSTAPPAAPLAPRNVDRYTMVRSNANRGSGLTNGLGNYTPNQCAAACDTLPQCVAFAVKGGDNCYLYSADQNQASNAPGFYIFHKDTPPPADVYKGKQVPISFAMANGGANQDQWQQSGGNGCAGFNGYFHMPVNNFGSDYNGKCPNFFKLSYCPLSLGVPTSGTYANPDGSPCDSSGPGCIGGDFMQNLQRKCNYSSINMSNFITPMGIFNDALGQQVLQDPDWKQAKNDYCSLSPNIDKTECRSWLSSGQAGVSYNSLKMSICNSEPNWGNDKTCVNAINGVYKTGTAAEKTYASTIVNAYCATNSTSNVCACPNATQKTIDQCVATPTLPGCDSISAKVGKLRTLGATFMSSELKPYCACDQCLHAAASSDGNFLAQPGEDCTDTINACFSQVTVGTMSDNSAINASCNISAMSGASSNTSPTSTTSPVTTPTTTPSPPSTTSPVTTPTTTPSPPTTQDYTGYYIGGGVILFCICLIIIGIMMMPKK